MFKLLKKVLYICCIIIAAAAIAAGMIFASNRDCDAKALKNPRSAQGTQDVDESLWKVCLALHRGFQYTGRLTDAYKLRDTEKIRKILANQYALTMPRCRKQLDLIAEDEIADYRDEVFLTYAFYYRLLELNESEELLQQAAQTNLKENWQRMPEEFVSNMAGFSSHMTRCAQMHGGYLLSRGYSKNRTRLIFSISSFDEDLIERIMFGSEYICKIINGQYEAELYQKLAHVTDKKQLEYYVGLSKQDDNYVLNFPIPSPEDKVWNAARYLDLSARNTLWLLNGKSHACGEKEQTAMIGWLAADLSICRSKINSPGKNRAPEVQQAALELCGAVENLLAHTAEYKSGKIDKNAFTQLLREDENSLNKKCDAMYHLRKDYLLRVTDNYDEAVELVLIKDGLQHLAKELSDQRAERLRKLREKH